MGVAWLTVAFGNDPFDQLQNGSALKIAPAELPDTKENIRSALSRATRQREIDIATSSDDNFLYVWKTHPSLLKKG